MKTMNIEMLHDSGASRSIVKVDIIRLLYFTIDGKRFTFAIHKNPEGDLRPPVLSEYRSSRRLCELSMGANQLYRRPDYATRAREYLAALIEKHGALKVRAVIESANRIN